MYPSQSIKSQQEILLIPMISSANTLQTMLLNRHEHSDDILTKQNIQNKNNTNKCTVMSPAESLI